MKKIYLIIAIAMFMTSTTSLCYALEVETHQALNENIAFSTLNGFSLDSYLTNSLGIEGVIYATFQTTPLNSFRFWEWLRDGGKYGSGWGQT